MIASGAEHKANATIALDDRWWLPSDSMGTWGSKPFENDDAADFAAELVAGEIDYTYLQKTVIKRRHPERSVAGATLVAALADPAIGPLLDDNGRFWVRAEKRRGTVVDQETLDGALVALEQQLFGASGKGWPSRADFEQWVAHLERVRRSLYTSLGRTPRTDRPSLWERFTSWLRTG